ncbi:MAG: SLC13 family permease [Bacteroidota bacterium]
MTIEIIFVLVLIAVAVGLFASEKLPIDLVALMIMGVLLISGIITPEEGISGFSNTATVTVGAMFIFSTALFKTGAVNSIGVLTTRAFKKNFWFGLVSMMLLVGALSAFVNNTPVVAIFIPILISAAREIGKSPSLLLMPLSFASMFGGVCTLIGSSTNILLSSIAVRHGLPAFGMFEFAPVGVVFLGVGILYMLVGVRLIPKRRGDDELTERFGMGDYRTEIIILPKAKSVGMPLNRSPLVEDVGIEVLEVIRGGKRVALPPSRITLQANDVLRVIGDVEMIKKLQEREGIKLKAEEGLRKWKGTKDTMVLVEAIIAPNTRLEGKSLKKVRFRDMYGVTALAIRHRGKLMRTHLNAVKLNAGDALLLNVRKDRLQGLQEEEVFVFVSEVGLPQFRRSKMIPALLIGAGIVGTAALGIAPIVVSAIAGCVLLVLLGCITLEEAYEAIDWKVIFLLAGALTLGVALEKTGAALLLSNFIVDTVGGWGPVALVAAFYLLTTILTETMSNNATAVLLAPIAIASAETLGIDPRPLLMAVTFAASASFMTPVGYQTNTMIYAAGQYRFADFLKVGTPLNLLFWILATILIPVYWPF